MKKFVIFLLFMMAGNVVAQTFSIIQKKDSLHILKLDTDSTHCEWTLKFPVYRFCTGDIDGDGIEEAMVGVIKPTRFIHQTDKRLFIYKNYKGNIQRMWMGSKIGGQIIDFCCLDGILICMSKMEENKYVIAKWKPARFGLDFVGYIAEDIDEQTAFSSFNELLNSSK